MKLIKFTSILLCFLMFTAMFAGCDTPEESKADISESNISEVPEEVSRQESETAEKIEPWGTDYDWDFLKGWPIHHDYLRGLFYSDWDYQNYSSEFRAQMKRHEKYEVLLHVAMWAYYPDIYDGSFEKLENKYKFADKEEIREWLEAGGIPLEYQTIRYFDSHGNEQAVRAFFGYLSFADVEKLIEYSEEYGYFLYFENIRFNEKDDRTDEMFDCPYCNNKDT